METAISVCCLAIMNSNEIKACKSQISFLLSVWVISRFGAFVSDKPNSRNGKVLVMQLFLVYSNKHSKLQLLHGSNS